MGNSMIWINFLKFVKSFFKGFFYAVNGRCKHFFSQIISDYHLSHDRSAVKRRRSSYINGQLPDIPIFLLLLRDLLAVGKQLVLLGFTTSTLFITAMHNLADTTIWWNYSLNSLVYSLDNKLMETCLICISIFFSFKFAIYLSLWTWVFHLAVSQIKEREYISVSSFTNSKLHNQVGDKAGDTRCVSLHTLYFLSSVVRVARWPGVPTPRPSEQAWSHMWEALQPLLNCEWVHSVVEPRRSRQVPLGLWRERGQLISFTALAGVLQ